MRLESAIAGSRFCAAVQAAWVEQNAVMLAKLGGARYLAELGVLPRHRVQHMRHADGLVLLGGGVGGIEHDIANVAAGKAELAGEEAEIQVGGNRGAGREHAR